MAGTSVLHRSPASSLRLPSDHDQAPSSPRLSRLVMLISSPLRQRHSAPLLLCLFRPADDVRESPLHNPTPPHSKARHPFALSDRFQAVGIAVSCVDRWETCCSQIRGQRQISPSGQTLVETERRERESEYWQQKREWRRREKTWGLSRARQAKIRAGESKELAGESNGCAR